MSRADIPGYLAHFRWRVLQDALTEATATYWERRATTFDWVAGDWTPGQPDPHGIARRARVDARNCRRHARILRETGLDAETRALIADALASQEAA